MSQARIAAIHEAGHAVIAAALGITVVSVALDGAVGSVRTYGPEKTAQDIERKIIVSMAGPLSQHIIVGTPLDHDAFNGDFRIQAEKLRKLPFSEPRRRRCWAQAVDLVRKNRNAVEAMADRLMEVEYGAIAAMADKMMEGTNGYS